MELLPQKKGHITKDEKEVAETLFALAGMFSDTNKADQQKIDDEKPEITSSGTVEEGISIDSAQGFHFSAVLLSLLLFLFMTLSSRGPS